ncbi:MAG: hypothetical protein EP343_23095 [Deltaproteobacteria bacterium]|nr:MAG: hypothetical protein EP343_23095 [Deltaproteobacteria bacterium]
MSTIKPKFPNVTTGDLQSKIDKLGDVVNEATVTGADGQASVDMERLEHLVGEMGDVALADGVEVIKDKFTTYEPVERVDTACGGTYTYNRPIEPESLDPEQVKSVFSALIEAKSKVSEHLGADGVLSPDEAKSARNLDSDFAGELAEVMVDGSVKDYKTQLRDWRETISETFHDQKARERLDDRILDLSEFHAETDEGAEALIWAFRAKATDPDGRFDLIDHRDQLEDAETSWLRFIPFVGRDVGRKKDHLSDREIRKYLDTDNLSGFIEEMKAVVEGQVGDYEAYLDGKDLPEIEQLNDPDFHPISTSCG